MTSRLLSFSRCEQPAPRQLDVDAVVLDVEVVLRGMIGTRVRLAMDLDGALPSISADPNQLRRLLVNLAVNARDAMPTGGVLTIETRHAAGEGVVELNVRDTGMGMDEGVRARLFEPFFTTKPVGKGTGLGLAAVQTIVSQCRRLDRGRHRARPRHDLLDRPADGRSGLALGRAGFNSHRARNAEIVVDSDGGFTVIQVRGEADAYTAPRIRSDLSSALGTSAPLVVDLSQATFIDSTVVGILLESLAEYEKRERALVLLLPDESAPEVHRLFELTGLTSLLPVVRSWDEAASRIAS